MTFYVLLLFGAIAFLLLLPSLMNAFVLNKKKKAINILENNWGEKNKEHNHDFHLTRMFHNLKIPLTNGDSGVEESCNELFLNDNLITDLDINELFEKIDNTHSKVGEQYLYYRLCRPHFSTKKLDHFESKVEHYSTQKENRVEVQYLLSKLNEYGAYFLPKLFLGQKKKVPSWSWIPVVLSILSLASFIGVFYDLVFLLGVIMFSSVNMIIHYWNKRQMADSIRSFSELKKLINVARDLQKHNAHDKEDFELDKVASMSKYLNIIQTEVRFSGGGFDDIPWMIFEYIKILFLLEINAYFRCLKFIENASEVIEEMYMYVGEIDAAISVANYRQQLPYFTKPLFTDNSKELIAEDVFHPLINNCTSNSINIFNKSILITGSNMSGKTTYIRAMAINAILSQTINTSITKKYIAPFFKVASSIRIQDDVEGERSYFLEEVIRIGELVSAVDDDSFPHLFVIDEVFKGTNTKERVAAAKAILSYLNQNKNIVMVATHDLELVPLLEDNFDLYHFEESVEEGKLVFDHVIKPGPLKTTNAIRLLEVSGYPQEIINNANAVFQS